jgi:hypothetical protein
MNPLKTFFSVKNQAHWLRKIIFDQQAVGEIRLDGSNYQAQHPA